MLRQNHVKATFFVVGTSAKAYPALVRQEARAGHGFFSRSPIINNHSA
ncbi:MAG: polysaccharide deacetylase family protein [Actinomycetota bacterium]|nr:polysaccharide deacetylase family protein [Actinomycetota bacterium]